MCPVPWESRVGTLASVLSVVDAVADFCVLESEPPKRKVISHIKVSPRRTLYLMETMILFWPASTGPC